MVFGFFSSATIETLSPESQHFSVERAASHSLVSLTHTCVSSAGWGETRIFQVRSCPLSCLPPERLKAKAERCSDGLKKLTSTESGETFKTHAWFKPCSTLAVGRMVIVSLSNWPGRAAKNSRIMGLFSWFLPFSSFLFSALTLDLKPFPHPLNQILEQNKPDEHNVPRGALGVYFHFCRTRTLQTELVSQRDEPDGSWWGPGVPGWGMGRHKHQLPAVTDGSWLSLLSLSLRKTFVAPNKCLSGVWGCHLFLMWGLPPLAMAF